MINKSKKDKLSNLRNAYILENEFIKLELLDYGARINSCIIKKLDVDVVLGYDNMKDILNCSAYIGATIGRVCNRIAKGKFTLNGIEYKLPINNNGNTLHGGVSSFDTKIFNVKSEGSNYIEFSYTSPDSEEGFPGNLTVNVIYRLLNDGWSYEVETTSDKDTICSITNHAYFNLEGHNSGLALDQYVQINADQYSHIDSNGLTLDKCENVSKTPFDFLQAKLLKNDIDSKHIQLEYGCGYDHNFIIKGHGLREAARLISDKLEMQVNTTLPCMHFYSGNFLGNTLGKNNTIYPNRSGLCFETQYYPNGINYDIDKAPILKKNETKKHITEFRYHIKEDN